MFEKVTKCAHIVMGRPSVIVAPVGSKCHSFGMGGMKVGLKRAYARCAAVTVRFRNSKRGQSYIFRLSNISASQKK